MSTNQNTYDSSTSSARWRASQAPTGSAERLSSFPAPFFFFLGSGVGGGVVNIEHHIVLFKFYQFSQSIESLNSRPTSLLRLHESIQCYDRPNVNLYSDLHVKSDDHLR